MRIAIRDPKYQVKVNQHAAAGGVAAIVLSQISVSGALVFWFSNVFVDMDHLLFYAAHEKKKVAINLKDVSAYGRWEYCGPRVNFFHNYETLVVLGYLAWGMGGSMRYLFWGVFFHLICDQAQTYWMYRFFRVRSLFGDIFRYVQFLKAKRRGRCREFMIFWRDSWWGHLKRSLPDDLFKKKVCACCIFDLYPDIPIDKDAGVGSWSKWF